MINLIRSVESSDPKLLAAIAKVETNESLKSDFEVMSAYILPCDPVAKTRLIQIRHTACRMPVLYQWLEAEMKRIHISVFMTMKSMKL